MDPLSASQQRSPSHSPRSTPPPGGSYTQLGNSAVAMGHDFKSADEHDQNIAEPNPFESDSQQDNAEKTEVSTPTFLGLQPFGKNKNKGYRPISFNPTSKLAQPVN